MGKQLILKNIYLKKKYLHSWRSGVNVFRIQIILALVLILLSYWFQYIIRTPLPIHLVFFILFYFIFIYSAILVRKDEFKSKKLLKIGPRIVFTKFHRVCMGELFFVKLRTSFSLLNWANCNFSEIFLQNEGSG